MSRATFDSYIREERAHKSNRETMTLSEFKYFNHKKHFLPEEDLLKIEEKLNSDADKIIYRTSEELLTHNLGFKFYKYYDTNFGSYHFKKEKSDHDVALVSLIRLGDFKKTDYSYDFDYKIDKTSISVKDFNKAKVIINNNFVLLFEPTNAQYYLITEYGSFLNKKSDQTQYNHSTILDNWDGLADKFILSGALNFKTDSFDTINQVFYCLFGRNLDGNSVEYNLNGSSYSHYFELYHIFEVFEKRINEKNYRIYITSYVERSYMRNYNIGILTEDDKRYNWIDKNRMFLKKENRNYYFDNNLIVPEFVKSSSDIKQLFNINIDLLNQLSRNLLNITGDSNIITERVYNFYLERYPLLQNYDSKSETELAIINKYIDILNKNKEIKLEHMIISNNKIEMIDQPFILEFEEKFLKIKEKLHIIRNLIKKSDIRYNFNELYENIIKESALKVIYRDNVREDDYKDFKEAEFLINKMKIVVKKEGNRIYINDEFCRISDVFDILSRAICYYDVNDYNNYIKDVSYIGWEWKKLIGTGAVIKLKMNSKVIMKLMGVNEDDAELRFSFLWDIKNRTKIYLLINNTKYLISHKNRIKHSLISPNLQFTMKDLKEILTEGITELTDDTFIQIIDHAIEEGAIIKKRAQELVEKTISDIGATKIELNISGYKKTGYLIIGKYSHAEYFVDEKDLSVYKKIDGSWNRRCVVNDHRKNRIFEDWLANRLVNIFNEPMYIGTIHN